MLAWVPLLTPPHLTQWGPGVLPVPLTILPCSQSPAESCDLLGDIQACIKKSMEETAQQPRAKATSGSQLLG